MDAEPRRWGQGSGCRLESQGHRTGRGASTSVRGGQEELSPPSGDAPSPISQKSSPLVSGRESHPGTLLMKCPQRAFWPNSASSMAFYLSVLWDFVSQTHALFCVLLFSLFPSRSADGKQEAKFTPSSFPCMTRPPSRLFLLQLSHSETWMSLSVDSETTSQSPRAKTGRDYRVTVSLQIGFQTGRV